MRAPLTAGEICTRKVIWTDPSMTLAEAARLMQTHHVGSLVVTELRADHARVVVGILTDRDISAELIAAKRNLHTFHVSDIMKRDVLTARDQDSILELLSMMRRKRVRRVPVTSTTGELIGIVTIDDILAVVAQQMQALADAVAAARDHEVRGAMV